MAAGGTPIRDDLMGRLWFWEAGVRRMSRPSRGVHRTAQQAQGSLVGALPSVTLRRQCCPARGWLRTWEIFLGCA